MQVTGATNMNTLYAGEQVTLTGSGFGTKDNGDPDTNPLVITGMCTPHQGSKAL